MIASDLIDQGEAEASSRLTISISSGIRTIEGQEDLRDLVWFDPGPMVDDPDRDRLVGHIGREGDRLPRRVVVTGI